ncbi:MAG TPA: T9SS type A sorting domain-containing protein [Bacteroidia bacterium]|nr:T9SS type A sorting domain-containing protein [Bacteroidia bacterium]
MTNKLVFLFSFNFFLNFSAFAQCDSTETKYCTLEIEGSSEGVDSEVICLDSNQLVISIEEFDWGYQGVPLSHSYTHFTYDNERNLTLSESPALTKDSYTWLPGHRVASHQQDVFYGGNWLTYQRTVYSYNSSNLLAQTNTRYKYYKAYTRNDSIAENFYYDSNGNDTLSVKDSIVNGQSYKSRIRNVFTNNLKVAEFRDSWVDSVGNYEPKILLSFHHNSSGFLTHIYQFNYSPSILAYELGENSRYEYYHDSLIRYSLTGYAYSYGSDSLNPDEFDVEDTYSYYPDGKLRSDSYVNYYSNNGGSIYYDYDPYGFLQSRSVGHISPGDISVDYDCFYYHYAIAGPDVICGNDTITLTAPDAEFYLWNTGDTTQSIQISTCYNCKFQCTITLFDGRTYETSPKKINKTVSPVFSTHGTVNYPQCKDNDLNLSLNPTIYTNYFWYRRDSLNQLINVYNGSSYYKASASQFLEGDYFAVASNACGVDTSTVFHVTLITPQPAHITALGPLKFCRGGSVSLLSNPAKAYKWSNNLTTQQISATYSDTYTLRTTDQNGCFSEDHIVVTASYSPVVPIITQVNNYLIPQDYSPKYQWYLNGNKISGATQRIYYPSQSGSYNLEFIAPDSSCSKMSASFSYVVSPLNVNIIDNTKAICENDSIYKGIGLLIEPNTGVPGYTYQWQPSANLIYPDSMFTYFRNTIAGWYKLTVRDALGQMDVDSIYITINPQPQAPHLLLPDSVYCEGGAYQKMITDVPNARLYIFYEMNNPLLFSATNMYYINKSSGYSARVMDNNYCISPMGPSLQVNMAPQSAYYPLAIYEHQPGFCETQNILLSTDARPNLRYFWSSNNLGIIPGADSSTITVTPNDYYTVYAMDSSGCTTKSPNHYVNRTFNTYPSISYPLGRSFCLGDSVLIETPYNPLFTYQWKANNNVLPNLDTNRIYTNTKLPNWSYYELTVTGPGCVGKAYASLNPIYPPSIGFIKRDSTLIAYSMDSILSYQWFFDSIAIPGATSISTPILKQGIYGVLTSNSKGCSGMSYFDFTCGLDYTKGIVSCEDTCSTRVHVIPKGTIPFSYSWNSSPTIKNVSNICPGNYVMQVTDRNGCIARDTILIHGFHSFAASPTIVISGNHLSSNSNHLPLQWYYNGTPIPGAKTSDLYPTQYGNYQLEFSSDDSICTKLSLPFSFAPLQLYATDTPVSFCKNDTLAGIGLDTEPTMGVPPFTYQWEPSAGLSQPTEFFTHFNATNSGWYTLTVTDAIGQSGKDSVEVNFLNSPVATITSQKGDTICNADSTLLSTNYDSTYHYTWYQNGQQIFNLDSNQIYADSGAYAVIIRNPQGCTASASISIHASAHPQFTLVKQNLTLHAISNENLNYQWFLDSVPLIGIQYDSLLISTQGIYSVVATNSFGCSSTQNFIFKCSLKLNSTYSSCTDSCSWSLNANSTGEAPIQYLWNTTAQTQNLTNVCSGFYKLMQIDKQGCTVSDSIVLTKISAEISLDSIQNTSCIGCNDGAVYFTDAGPYSILFPQADTSYSNSFSGLVADTFSICAVSYTGCIICRTVIIYDEPLSVSSLHSTAEVLVYPNPFSDKTNFVFTKQDNYSIQILDVLGREVGKLISNGRNLVTFNREELSDGIYFYQIKKNESIIFSGKMVAE